MRKYREQRKTASDKPPRELKVGDDQLLWAIDQRKDGRTFRAIAEELGVDHSYLARRIKSI